MKFTAISVTEASNVPERVLLDGFTVQIASGEPISLDGQWVEVIGVESDAFKDAELTLRRDLLLGMQLSQPEIDRRVKASLITGWSFEEECNLENKLEALKLWPSRLTAHLVAKAEGRVNANFTNRKSKPS